MSLPGHSSYLFSLGNREWKGAALFAAGFADASFCPLPVTTMFLLFLLSDTGRLKQFTLVTVLGIVLGAMAGFAAGRFLWIGSDGQFTRLAVFFFDNIPGFSREAYARISYLFSRWNIILVFFAIITPLPYGLISVSSGVFNINTSAFVLSTLVSQAFKYTFLSFMIKKQGPLIFKYLKPDGKPLIFISAVILLISLITIFFL